MQQCSNNCYNRRSVVSLISDEECTSLGRRNPHFSGDAAPPPISDDDSSQNACLQKEEKAGMSAAATAAGSTAEASAALNVPT